MCTRQDPNSSAPSTQQHPSSGSSAYVAVTLSNCADPDADVATAGEEESEDEAAMSVKGTSEMASEAEDAEPLHEEGISSDESDTSADASDDDDDDNLEEEKEDNDDTCMTCGLDDDESHLVLCDGRGCEAASHCCRPPSITQD